MRHKTCVCQAPWSMCCHGLVKQYYAMRTVHHKPWRRLRLLRVHYNVFHVSRLCVTNL